MSNTSKRTTDLSEASADAWLDDLLVGLFSNAGYLINSAGVKAINDAKTEVAAHLQEREAAAELRGRIAEIDALYARADHDPILRDKLDELYRLRYENLGGGNIFTLDRLAELLAVREGRA